VIFVDGAPVKSFGTLVNPKTSKKYVSPKRIAL